MRKRLEVHVSLIVLLAVSAACLAIGVAVGVASGNGSSSSSATQSAARAFNFRAQATSPRPELQKVLSESGLVLKAACQLANGLPVLELGLQGPANASFGIHYGLQDDETPTQVFHQIPQGQVTGLLGPIGKGDGGTGTLTYLRPDGGAVTVNFVAMTKAFGTDCVVGGTVVASSR